VNILLVDDKASGSHFVGRLADRLRSLAGTKLFVSTNPICASDHFVFEHSHPEQRTGRFGALEDFLRTIDVLILDLHHEQGAINSAEKLTPEKIRSNLESDVEISDSELERLKGSFAGIGFFHQHFSVLKNVQAVFVLTAHDEQESPGQPGAELARKFIDPFCGIDRWRPYTAKYVKDALAEDHLLDRVECMAKLFVTSGYVSLDNLSGIEFAAFHDHPVMLLGESGTGKEYAAEFIHHRWAQEKRRKGEGPDTIQRNYAAINCAALTEELATSVLFGFVRGAFTGALEHSLGLILGKGCGLRLGGTGSFADRAGLRELEGDWVLPIPTHADKRKWVCGTLFLDEFGDLSPPVQAKLLRYLQSFEVPVLGLNGVVKNARLRVITATSDPRIAAAVGYGGDDPRRLRGQIRSDEEKIRPLRMDLVFRVCDYPIRLDPVTCDKGDKKGNLTDVVDRFIANSDSKASWGGDARRYLIEKLQAQIEQSEEAEGESDGYRPVFGHKRQIKKSIVMIEEFFNAAKSVGRRPHEEEITPHHVDAMFHKTGILVSGIEKRKPSDEAWDTALIERTKAALADLVDDGTVPLTRPYSFKDLQNAFKRLGKAARAAVRDRLWKAFDGEAAADRQPSFLKGLGASDQEARDGKAYERIRSHYLNPTRTPKA
jgi:hypothetical protein